MEWTTRHPVRALLLQLNVVLDHTDDISLPSKIVDECLGVTHSLELILPVEAPEILLGQVGLEKCFRRGSSHMRIFFVFSLCSLVSLWLGLLGITTEDTENTETVTQSPWLRTLTQLHNRCAISSLIWRCCDKPFDMRMIFQEI